MTTDDHQDQTARDAEDDRLWRLLERAPRPQPVSPYFARRVLREVAASGEMRSAGGGIAGWFARLGLGRVAFAGALAAVLLVAVGVGLFSPAGLAPSSPAAPVGVANSEPAIATIEGVTAPAAAEPAQVASTASAAEPVVTAQDVEVIADLDNLVSREENRLWTEEDSTARF